MAVAVRPVPRFTSGKLSPMSLLRSPRSVLSPSPSRPSWLSPQHWQAQTNKISPFLNQQNQSVSQPTKSVRFRTNEIGPFLNRRNRPVSQPTKSVRFQTNEISPFLNRRNRPVSQPTKSA
eukprot:1192870-Prorocentrum_minimum.AAC.4